MTLNDLKDEVAALGFDDGLSLDRALTLAANRALITIFTERPIAKTVRIISNVPTPSYHTPKIVHSGSRDIEIAVRGRAYVFRVSGKGRFTLYDGALARSYDFDSKNALFRGIIRTEDAKIVFSGDWLYTVYSFTVYPELVGEGEESIREYSPYTEYDINGAVGDFLAFLEPPRHGGKPISDAYMQNGILRIPHGKYDEVYLTYARMPRRISLDNPAEKIDVSGECISLLPLLTAAYIWLDDDADKAQYYMSLYREGMGFIRRFNIAAYDAAYTDTTGWA